MKRLFYIALLLPIVTMLWTGCKGEKADTQASDSCDSDTVVTDSVIFDADEKEMPKAADELFDDFVFNFASNKRLQVERIKFPLPVTGYGKTDSITRKAWKTDYFFMRQGYYTLLLDSKKDLELAKDTAIGHVVIEHINIPRGKVKQYIFDRERGQWMLTRIHNMSLNESDKAGFLGFYERFATDSTFQSQSLAETIEFSGPDPDDDFSTMEGIITPDTWQAFAPEFPHGEIYDIIYGNQKKNGNQKIFLLRGIANGLEMDFTFRKSPSGWRLTKLNT